MRTQIVRACFLAAIALIRTHAATLSLNPEALAGLPDSTVGWGFTITGDSGQWLLVTFADFVPDTGSNPVGVFTPFITQLPNSNTVIGDGEVNPWSQVFDSVLATGIGSYHINDFQLPGDHVEGAIVLYYDVYSADPNDPLFDPSVDTFAVGQILSAPAAVQVVDVVPDTQVPEPGTFSLLLLALCAFNVPSLLMKAWGADGHRRTLGEPDWRRLHLRPLRRHHGRRTRNQTVRAQCIGTLWRAALVRRHRPARQPIFNSHNGGPRSAGLLACRARILAGILSRHTPCRAHHKPAERGCWKLRQGRVSDFPKPAGFPRPARTLGRNRQESPPSAARRPKLGIARQNPANRRSYDNRGVKW
jgi:hypothetical protein